MNGLILPIKRYKLTAGGGGETNNILPVMKLASLEETESERILCKWKPITSSSIALLFRQNRFKS